LPERTLARFFPDTTSALLSDDGMRVTLKYNNNALEQQLSANDLLKAVACSVGQDLSDEELVQFKLAERRFSHLSYSCP
jgi:hypothetical protein